MEISTLPKNRKMKISIADFEMHNFCTIFDSNYIPFGLNLFQSLAKFNDSFTLWVLAVDQDCFDYLSRLPMDNLKVLSASLFETEEMLEIKRMRSRGEYCWTLKPLLLNYLLSEHNIEIATYLDADLYFFDDPALIIEDLLRSKKDVLITDHCFDPQYDISVSVGQFCAQLLTFKDTARSLEVLNWWQEKCVDWCGQTPEPNRFGDQKYLERFNSMFPNSVHVCALKDRILGPWNVSMWLKQRGAPLQPIFYHFHGLKIVDGSTIQCFQGYQIPKEASPLYDAYTEALINNIKLMKKDGLEIQNSSKKLNLGQKIKKKYRQLSGRERQISF